MPYVNVGAWIDQPDGEKVRVKSKKLLRETLKAEPSSVLFDKTSVLDSHPDLFRGDDLPAGVTLQVTGPDPYTSRKWYASVERTADGGARVKQ